MAFSRSEYKRVTSTDAVEVRWIPRPALPYPSTEGASRPHPPGRWEPRVTCDGLSSCELALEDFKPCPRPLDPVSSPRARRPERPGDQRPRPALHGACPGGDPRPVRPGRSPEG